MMTSFQAYAVVQRGQPDARSRALDADDHHSRPVVGAEGVPRVRRDRPLKSSAYYDRVVDVMEELVKFTLLTRDVSGYLTDRYSERKEDAAKLEQRVCLKSI
jgi:hypothetical protein